MAETNNLVTLLLNQPTVEPPPHDVPSGPTSESSSNELRCSNQIRHCQHFLVDINWHYCTRRGEYYLYICCTICSCDCKLGPVCMGVSFLIIHDQPHCSPLLICYSTTTWLLYQWINNPCVHHYQWFTCWDLFLKPAWCALVLRWDGRY